MNPNPEIIVKHAPGTKSKDKRGSDLKGCYFQARRHRGNVMSFRLHEADGKKIHTEPHHLKNGENFTFKYGGLYWSVTDFSIGPAPEGIWIATGNWSADKKKHILFNPPHEGPGQEDPETGTFQAQSGGGTGLEYEASASASA